MATRGKKHGIPDRWLDYKAVGRRLDGTRFIAFKVPLKQSLNSRLPASDVFGPWELLDALRKENQELGLIIDLTFTTRYYKLQDLPNSLMWVKIFTAGHDIPNDATILSFKRAVRRFLRENAANDHLIGVHCTHGLNRTGYLICRYLIDVDGMDPKEAIELFKLSRGHAMERDNYLEDLQCGPKRSNDGIDEPEAEPLRGHAVHRPCFTPFSSDTRGQRPPHLKDPWYHRTLPHRGMNQGLPYRLPHGDQLPGRPLPPKPPTCAAMAVPQQPYRWTSPHSFSPGSVPFHPQQSRAKYPPPQSDWKAASRPSQHSVRRHSSTSWIASNGYGHPEDGAGFRPDFIDAYTE